MENKLKIIVGSSNPHKIQEMNEIAKNYNVEFLPVDSDDFDPVEDGETFMENAEIKAMEAMKKSKTGKLFLADDSGLCVDALSGAPGIHSARYADTPLNRINKLLSNMKDKSDRSAHFICTLCLVDKKGNVLHKETGKVFGKIGYEIKGENGFGYDPIFIVNNINRTMAELSESEKNTLSHRGQALKQMLEWLKTQLL